MNQMGRRQTPGFTLTLIFFAREIDGFEKGNKTTAQSSSERLENIEKRDSD
jgi:hypothetical protein